MYLPYRATYAAENAVQRLEKGKKEQDLLIDHLHGQIKGHQRQIALFTQQHAAQQRETRAAQETLAEAAAEMEGVAFEKKQLTAQWQSSLIAMQKRDEALKVTFHFVPRLVLQCGNLGSLTQGCRAGLVSRPTCPGRACGILLISHEPRHGAGFVHPHLPLHSGSVQCSPTGRPQLQRML